MLDLTVVILTKNEEINLKKCVKSFNGIASRFVIVDSFSTDKTKEVCLNLGLDFYEHEFKDHASQFNWALNNTNISTQWIMRMDADEELTTELTNEIQVKLNSLPLEITGVILKRRVYFMDKWIKYGGVYPQCLLRIFRNGAAVCEQKVMDEHIVLLKGRSIKFSNDLIDNNTKDLEWWTNKHNWYSNKEVVQYMSLLNSMSHKHEVRPTLFKGQAERKRWIKNFLYYKVPLFKRPKWYFFYRYIILLGFLDGKEGLIFHFLQGYWYRFLVDAKIYEHQKRESLQNLQMENKIQSKNNLVR